MKKSPSDRRQRPAYFFEDSMDTTSLSSTRKSLAMVESPPEGIVASGASRGTGSSIRRDHGSEVSIAHGADGGAPRAKEREVQGGKPWFPSLSFTGALA